MTIKKYYARKRENFSYGKFLLIVSAISLSIAAVEAGASLAFICLALLVTTFWIQFVLVGIAILLAILALEELFTVPGILFTDAAYALAKRHRKSDPAD